MPHEPPALRDGQRSPPKGATRMRVRSFVTRGGRLTTGQARALQLHWVDHGLENRPLADLAAVFGNRNPVSLEIGFGAGENLLEAAAANPDHNYLGVEVYASGIGRVLRAAHEGRLANVRVFRGDAADVVELLPDHALESAWIFFPDPWPKKRHHKRRLVSPSFIVALQRKIASGGRILIATDWEDYARQMLGMLDATPGLENTAGLGNFAERPMERLDTRYAERARRLGHRVWELAHRVTPH